ncbi:MAG: hypothetical protein QNJ72_08215 [Pleurocapsa sp. MO_226.B13]|nr:hypothetical protein [Pleurocapsa sp. MO_226.B13]
MALNGSIETNQPTFTQDFKNDFERAILTTETPSHNTSSCQWIDWGNKLWRLLRYREAEQSFQQAIDRPDPKL